MGILRDTILDIIFPRKCIGCNLLLENKLPAYFCRECINSINLLGKTACAFCLAPVVNGKTCQFCIKKHYLDRLLVAASYDNPLVERSIKTMKYRFIKLLASDISELMSKHLKNQNSVEISKNPREYLVVPVPLHRQRFNWRGFNQAEVISANLSKELNLNLETNLLIRKTGSRPQAEISDRYSRIQNIKGIFQINKDMASSAKDKKIILVDDVSTTGSTLDDCARALKECGVKEVIGFVFARGKI